MINTPNLKKQQQKLKKSLSAKKCPAKGLRNVLSQPYDAPWPVLHKDDESCLEEILQRLLPDLKRDKQCVPWSQLRKMGKEERRIARENMNSDSKDRQRENTPLKFITFGVNAVTRDLEKDRVCSILLDSGVDSILVKHVVLMAQDKNVPLLLVPFLKKLTLENLGFASAALSLKSEVTESDDKFNELHREIVKLSPTILVEEDTRSSVKKMVQETEVEPEVAEEREKTSQDKNSSSTFKISANVYKFRNSRKERAFVPPEVKSTKEPEEMGDFIALGEETDNLEPEYFSFRKNQRYMDVCNDEVEKNEKKNDETISSIDFKAKSKKVTYLPLKVKRIQGNNNRLKAMKTKKKMSKKK